MVYIGGTVLVEEDEAIELNPCTAELLPAAGKKVSKSKHNGTKIIRDDQV